LVEKGGLFAGDFAHLAEQVEDHGDFVVVVVGEGLGPGVGHAFEQWPDFGLSLRLE
jgi:hypothetical protein